MHLKKYKNKSHQNMRSSDIISHTFKLNTMRIVDDLAT